MMRTMPETAELPPSGPLVDATVAECFAAGTILQAHCSWCGGEIVVRTRVALGATPTILCPTCDGHG